MGLHNRQVDGQEGKGPGTRCCPSGRPMSSWELDPALADCHRLMSTGDQVQRWQTGDQADADSSNPPQHRGGVEGGQREESRNYILSPSILFPSLPAQVTPKQKCGGCMSFRSSPKTYLPQSTHFNRDTVFKLSQRWLEN